jgi:hypothetical protein
MRDVFGVIVSRKENGRWVLVDAWTPTIYGRCTRRHFAIKLLAEYHADNSDEEIRVAYMERWDTKPRCLYNSGARRPPNFDEALQEFSDDQQAYGAQQQYLARVA